MAILVGLTARIVRFSLDLQVYHDEAYLLNNLLVRDYGGLMAPLGNAQAAPPAFCWAIKWCAGLGTSDRAVRLLPFIAGVAAFGLFGVLCRQFGRGGRASFAFAVFAASHVIIVSTARAKPYASDLLVGAAFALLAVRWLRRPRSTGPLWVMLVLAPLFVWCSYTSVFVIGGVGLAIAAFAVMHARQIPRHAWLALTLTGVLSLASFAALYAVHLNPALTGAGNSGLREFWADAFPPLESLPRTIGWFITAHTGRLYSYPVGEKGVGSVASLILWLIGVVVIGRSSRGRWTLALLLAPQLLLLIAAVAGKYPYGGHARISLFLAPSMCLLIGIGMAECTRGCSLRTRHRARAILAGILLAIPMVEIVSGYVELARTAGKDSVAGVIADVARKAGPADRIVCVHDSLILGGGGESRQIFEYYMQRLLTGRVRWKYDVGGLLERSPASSTRHAADASGPARVYVIGFLAPDDARMAKFLARSLPPIRRCRILPNKPGDVAVWEAPVEAGP